MKNILFVLFYCLMTSFISDSNQNGESEAQRAVARQRGDYQATQYAAYLEEHYFTLRIDVTYYSGGGMGCTSLKSLVGAYYHPDIDSSNSVFNPNDATRLRWCAVSQDLLWFNGGPIKYGDVIWVNAGRMTGKYTVKDAMAPHMKHSVDILVSNGDHYHEGRWVGSMRYMGKVN